MTRRGATSVGLDSRRRRPVVNQFLSTLRNLRVLCVSAVNVYIKAGNRRGTENAEITQS